MNRITIVQAIIRQIRAENYVEIGVSKGHAFLSMDVKNKIAVDPCNLIDIHKWDLNRDNLMLEFKKFYRSTLQSMGVEKSRFFEVPSDNFFKNESALFQNDKIDVAFIDGLHSYGQALRDVQNCLEHLSERGVIVLHDCNPVTAAQAVPAESFEEAAAQKVPGWDNLWCGDVWKVIVHLRSFYPDLRVFVIDCDMGIGIVTRGAPDNILAYSQQEINQFQYDDLECKREYLLNLKPAAYFNNFLHALPQV